MAASPGGKASLAILGLLLLSGTAVALVDIALIEFVLWGDKTTTSLAVSGAIFDIGEAELIQMYGDKMNFSRVRIFDRNVTTCDMMDQKATFWATRYFYREAEGNPVMGMFGPGTYPSVQKFW